MASFIPGYEYNICLRKATADKSSSATVRKIIKKEGARVREKEKTLPNSQQDYPLC